MVPIVRDQIIEWIKEEGLGHQIENTPDTHFLIKFQYPHVGDKVINMGMVSPKEHSDKLIIFIMMTPGPKIQTSLKRMSDEIRTTSFREMAMELLKYWCIRPDVGHGPEGFIIRIQEKIFSDGLTKDKLFNAIEHVMNCFLYWDYRALDWFDRPMDKSDSTYTP